ncbi:unnamed protein product, partial [Meganyctiphanes norvegica]
MNKKPKLFYGFIKNKNKRDNRIGPFKIDGEYVMKNKDICERLVKQYNTQFRKLGRWIREFLSERKFRVVANGEFSEEHHVKSGVPQGTVLAAILFIIMISDIDEDIIRCIVRCFADDTRINMKVKTEEDKKTMQEDLNKIYMWAEENVMKFNETKFEQMTCGVTKEVSVEPYKTSTGKEIEFKSRVKDLGVVTNEKLNFKEHIDSVVLACKIKQGNIFRKFSTRKEDTLMKLYKTHIRSKAEYCCIVWSPT